MAIFERIHHVGIAVASIDSALPLYRDLLNMKPGLRKTMVSQGVEVQFLELPGTLLELLAPLSEDSVIARFLSRHGSGMHHLAYEVSDIRSTLKELQDTGFDLIDEEPREGAEGKLVAFLRPGSMGGVLVELQER